MAIPEHDVDRVRQRIYQLAGLAEPEMRRTALGEELARSHPEDSIWLLEAMVEGTLRNDSAAQRVYDAAFSPARVDELLKVDRREVFEVLAQESGCIAATVWLGASLMADVPQDKDTRYLVSHDLRDVALGNRRAWARKASGEQLKKLMLDPDPGVIGNLLNNPKLTEEHVLAICSRRPTVSIALEAVIDAPKWIRRYRVKLALARNPYLQRSWAISLLAYLKAEHLREIRDDATLAAAVRLGSQRLLMVLSQKAGPKPVQH